MAWKFKGGKSTKRNLPVTNCVPEGRWKCARAPQIDLGVIVGASWSAFHGLYRSPPIARTKDQGRRRDSIKVGGWHKAESGRKQVPFSEPRPRSPTVPQGRFAPGRLNGLATLSAWDPGVQKGGCRAAIALACKAVLVTENAWRPGRQSVRPTAVVPCGPGRPKGGRGSASRAGMAS